MAPTSPLDTFGALVCESLRDVTLSRAEALLAEALKSPDMSALQSQLHSFSSEQRETLRGVVRNSIDAGIHDFLFKLQELSDSSGSIKVLVNGQDIAALSDGLHGEAYSERGWFARFSAFPSG